MILILIFLAGVPLLLYPTVSDYWNTLHASAAVTSYAQQVSSLDNGQCSELLSAARAYNQSLSGRDNPYVLPAEQKAQYESLLNLDGTGFMGYIEIPNIDLSLPIYHGDLKRCFRSPWAIWTGPACRWAGGSTHCVLSGHRGLPSAKLFTNLDKLVVGDTFVIRILDEALTYEVTKILIVEPTETEEL